MNIDENRAEELINNYIAGVYGNNQDEQDETATEDYILNYKDFFDKFIEENERNIFNAPENFSESVMQKINAANSIKTVKTIKVIPVLSRKLRAAVCFASAFIILLSAVFGVNARIFDFFSVNSDKLEKIGEFFNIISKFNLN